MDELTKAQFDLSQKRQHASNIQGHINELEHQVTTGGHSPAVADQIAELRPQLENALQAAAAQEAEVARLRELGVSSAPTHGAVHPHHPPGSTVQSGPGHAKSEARTPKAKPDPRKKHV